jgi:phosphatidylglycerophosphate synthase/uncharacterized protein Yka (UPF0111/DUF47 family)
MPSKYRLRIIFKPIINYLAKILIKIKSTPNLATLTMLIMSVMSFFSLSFLRIEWLFGIFVFLTGIFDGIDGAIARQLNEETKLGGLFDSISDRISEILIFFTMFLYFWNQKLWGFIDIALIIYISLGASLLISYIRTRAENFRPGDYDIGLMARSERLFFIFISSIFGLLLELLLVFMILTVATAIFRLVKIYFMLKKQNLLETDSKENILKKVNELKGKDKKDRKLKMQDLFIQLAEKVEQALTNMNNTIINLCNNKPAETKKSCEATVLTEQEADKIFEEISERLFSREVMVFSRTDRLYIAKHIEQVIDATETVSRRIIIHKPKLYPKSNEMLKDVGNKAKEIGKILNKAVVRIFDDFDEAERLVNQIQSIRHESREIQYQFLEELYRVKPEHTDLSYYIQVINKILASINKAENFGDGIRGLVWKYRL